MSKKGEFRQFHLGFWQSPDVEEMDPIEKLLYVYMITSPKSNMEGVYKTTLRRVSFETGIDRDMIPKLSARLEEKGIGGVFVKDSGTAWVVISSAPEFMPGTPQIKQRFRTQLEEWPQALIDYLYKVNYQWPKWEELEIPRPSESDPMPMVTRPSPDGHRGSPEGHPTLCRHDTDTDTIQYNTDTIPSAPTAEADASHDAPSDDNLPATTEEQSKPPAPMPPLKDPVARQWEESLTEIQPADTWSAVGKERKACGDLAKKSTRMLSQAPYQSMPDLIGAVIGEYRRIKGEAKRSDTYWRNAPYTPAAILTRWDQIWHSLASRYEQDAKQHEYERTLQEVPF